MADQQIFTKNEIYALFSRAAERCQESWQMPYRLGYQQGIAAVMIEFDDYRHNRKPEQWGNRPSPRTT